MRHQFLAGDRVTSYLDSGTTAAVEAGTVVFLHAFPLSAEMWRPQLDCVPAGWRFIAPDLRGFGLSVPAPPTPGAESPGAGRAAVSIDDFAQDVVGLLDALHLPRVVVAGLSMGGYAAFALLRAAPARIRGLVLADTRAGADGPGALASRDRMIEALDSGGPEIVADRMLPGLLGATTRASRPELVEQVRRLMVSQPAEAIREALLRLKGRPDSAPLLADIVCPTLVVAGAEDEITGVDAARQIHDGVSGSSLTVIEHAGHLPNMEQPAAFNAALGRFLAQWAASS
jgi:pimeloyl-ACP methyl ester carboxylesterase